MKTGTVIKGAAIIGGVVAAGVLFKLFAVPVLIATLVIAVVTYFWKKFVDFWLDKLQAWVQKHCGQKICSALGSVIAFLNTPISRLRMGSKAAFDASKRVWQVIRGGLKSETCYKKDGDEVIIETRIADSETEVIVQKKESFYDLPTRVRTEVICSDEQCYKVNNHDVIDRKFTEAEKEMCN